MATSEDRGGERGPIAQGTYRHPSLFLDLPAELRNLIYEFVAGDAVVLVNPNHPGVITDGSRLLRVSKAIRGEYLDVLIKTSRIVAEIRDFKFRPLVSFLNKLDKRTLHLLRRSEASKKRSICITVHLDEGWQRSQVRLRQRTKRLRQWLSRCTTPSETIKGANVEFSYEIKVPKPVPYTMPGTQLYDFKWHLLDTWPKPDGTRFFDELIKIVAATNRADDELGAWRKHMSEEIKGGNYMPSWEVADQRHPCSVFYDWRTMKGQ